MIPAAGAGPAVWVGVDVGGTKVAAGVVEDGRVLRSVLHDMPGRDRPAGELEDVLTAAVAEVAAADRVAGVGVAAAGFVDAAGERVRFAPHLPWRDAPVRARLQERWAVPVALDNDATAAAAAEATYGAATGASSAVVVTVGTGIGGGLVVDGRVLRGHQGMAGEFGHMRLVPRGRDCECGGQGCWEQYCSGRALLRVARGRLGSVPTVLEELCGGRPERLTGPMVTRAAAMGDLVAHQAFEEVGEWLGAGLATLVAAFDPAVVVVGGGLSQTGERLLGPARSALRDRLVGAAHREVPAVLPAALGAEAGMVGAALAVRQRAGR